MPMADLNPPPLDTQLQSLIRMSVAEDLAPSSSEPFHDRTVELAIPESLHGTATIVARRPGVFSGGFLLAPILAQYNPALRGTLLLHDGAPLTPGQHVARIAGPVRAILSAERVVLNFLGHLSGIATLTRRYVDGVSAAGSSAQICDTRKTTPGFRLLDKYAVRCGGGVNHRLGLYDGVMLKDNHLAALRDQLGPQLTLAQLTRAVRAQIDPAVTLWLEVDTLTQLAEALPSPSAGAGADIILLDNFTPDQMQQAVRMRNNQGTHPLLEASGGVTLDTLAAVARTGVERISIGALTHSAPALDLSTELN